MKKEESKRARICIGDVIQEYAWKKYLLHLGRPRRHFVKKAKYDIRFDWDCLAFQHSTETFVQDNDTNSVMEAINFSASLASLSTSKVSSKSYISADSDVAAPCVLCSAKFENRHRKRRRFRLSGEKETPVSVTVHFNEYFTLDSHSNIQLNIPANFIPGDKSQHSLLVTDPANQKFSNTYKWKVNSAVIVKGCHKVKASYVVSEQENISTVTVNTRVSKVTEWFPVDIVRKSDSSLVYTCFITSLGDVFKPHTGPNLSLVEIVDDDMTQNTHILLTSRGTCKAKGWADQQILMSSERPLECTV